MGSAGWRQAVLDARTANGDHMAEEERAAIADFRQHADLDTRHQLGVAFAAYEAAHRTGIELPDKDADTYVAQNS